MSATNLKRLLEEGRVLSDTGTQRSAEDVAREQAGVVPKTKGNKFGAKKVTIDGHTFDSKKEGQRYRELRAMQRAGEIARIELQPEFKAIINDRHCFTYRADFRYTRMDEKGVKETVIEDVKGYKKGAAFAHFRTKKKVIEALFGIEIKEV